MPTLLDSLVVSLGLSGVAAFNKGQAQAKTSVQNLSKEEQAAERRRQTAARNAQRLQREQDRQEAATAKARADLGKQAVEQYNRVRNAVIAVSTAILGGRALQVLGRDAAGADAAVGRMAVNLGISTNALSAWDNVAERVGGQRGSISAAFQGIQNQIQNFRLFGQALTPVFQNLGVQLADPLTGVARSSEVIYSDILERLHRRRPEERAAIASALGLGQETVNLAALPGSERARLLADQQRLGTVSPREARLAAERQRAWLDLDQAMETARRRIVTALTPAFDRVLEALTKFFVWLNSNDAEPYIRRLNDALDAVSGYLSSPQFISDVQSFTTGVGNMARAIIRAMRWLGFLDAEEPPSGDRNSLATVGGTGGPLVAGTYWGRGGGWSGTVPPPARPGGGPAGDPRQSNYVPQPGALDAAALRDRLAADLGLSPERAAELVSAFHFESAGLRPDSVRPGGTDSGLAQFVGPRRRALQAFAAQRGTSWTDPETQIRFITQELTQGSQRHILERLRTGNARDAAHDYESGGAALFNTPQMRGHHSRMADSIARLPSSGVGAGGQVPFVGGAPAAPRPGETVEAREIRLRAEGEARRAAAPPSRIPGATGTLSERAASDREWRRTHPSANPDGEAVLRRQLGLDPALSAPGRAPAASPPAGNTTTSAVTINGPINVQTAATDAGGIARDMGTALRRRLGVDQVNRGLA